MELSLELAAQLAWTGLASSSYYCLFAVAFALVLKVSRVWNFGQAGLMVVAYFAMFVCLQRLKLPVAASLAIGFAATMAAALALERFGFRVLRQRNSSVLTYFIFTIAFSQCAIYVAELIFGTDPKTLFASIVWPVMLVGPVVVSHWDMIALTVTLALFAGLYVFVRKTREGKAMIAVSDEPDLAEMYGMSRDRAYGVAMLLAAVMMAAGMFLIGARAAMYPATPLNQFLIYAVIATILAGIGNIFRAALAAVGLALLQSFSVLFIASKWQILMLYVLIFVVIIVFPRGVTLNLRRRGPMREAAALEAPAKEDKA
ncbi:MAG: branched-chain amino acid ABC transporter permease [Betaproteobacteria bacterium]|jgi:branched-chain amino acid transport system permease protein